MFLNSLRIFIFTRFNTIYIRTRSCELKPIESILSFLFFSFFPFLLQRERETIGACTLLISFLRLHSRRFDIVLPSLPSPEKPSPEVKVRNFLDKSRVITCSVRLCGSVLVFDSKFVAFNCFLLKFYGFDFNAVLFCFVLRL